MPDLQSLKLVPLLIVLSYSVASDLTSMNIPMYGRMNLTTMFALFIIWLLIFSYKSMFVGLRERIANYKSKLKVGH